MSQKREKEIRRAVREAHAAAEEAHLMSNTCAIIKHQLEQEAAGTRRYADRAIIRQDKAWSRALRGIDRTLTAHNVVQIMEAVAIALLALHDLVGG